MPNYICPLCLHPYDVNEDEEDLRYVLCGLCHVQLLYYRPPLEEMIN